MKNARSLDAIAGEIHAMYRDNIFGIGDKLIEARASCEHGEFMAWLDEEFDFSHSTAYRWIEAAELAANFPRVRKMRVPARAIHRLAVHKDDIPLTADIISELVKESKSRRLRLEEVEHIEWRCDARRRHGAGYPDPTLEALDDLSVHDCSDGCREQIAAALKGARPATENDAHKIVADHLYAEHGELPVLPHLSLDQLRYVNADKRGAVLLALQAAPKPISHEYVHGLIAPDKAPDDELEDDDADDDHIADDDEGDTDQDDDGDEAEVSIAQSAPSPSASPASSPASPPDPEPDLLGAWRTMAHYGRRRLPEITEEFTFTDATVIEALVRSIKNKITGRIRARSAADRAERSSAERAISAP